MTDAEKRKKVIKSFETAVKNFERYSGDEYGREYDYARVEVETLEDAIAMLKAQEPRVVKIPELTSGEPMLVWLEDKGEKDVVAGMIFDYVPGRFGFKLTDIGSMDRIYPLIDEYYTRWRAWTSRPTDAQREAVKWE